MQRESHGPSESGQDALVSAGSVSDKVILREPLKALGTEAGNTCRLQAVPFQQLSHGAVADAANRAVTQLQSHFSGTLLKAGEKHLYSLQIHCLELVREGKHAHSFLQRTKQS